MNNDAGLLEDVLGVVPVGQQRVDVGENPPLVDKEKPDQALIVPIRHSLPYKGRVVWLSHLLVRLRQAPVKSFTK